MKTFTPGDTVRLTGLFLRNTGQQAGGEGQSRWTVQAVTTMGRSAYVLTDELRPNDGMFTPEELAQDPTLRYRRINAANLERCK